MMQMHLDGQYDVFNPDTLPASSPNSTSTPASTPATTPPEPKKSKELKS